MLTSHRLIIYITRVRCRERDWPRRCGVFSLNSAMKLDEGNRRYSSVNDTAIPDNFTGMIRASARCKCLRLRSLSRLFGQRGLLFHPLLRVRG